MSQTKTLLLASEIANSKSETQSYLGIATSKKESKIDLQTFCILCYAISKIQIQASLRPEIVDSKNETKLDPEIATSTSETQSVSEIVIFKNETKSVSRDSLFCLVLLNRMSS